MKNVMQLKAVMKNLAKEKHISAQLIMQNYMLERLLERISLSKYRDSFILKGGFLIAAMVGLDTRATMDIDATIKGLPVNGAMMEKMFKEICEIKLDDDVFFMMHSISEIREKDEYNGFRIALTANYPPMEVPLKIDVTTGDKITPREIEYRFKLMLEDRSISVLAYNLETILAEKLETIISRGNQNTRPRDYYDIHILTKLQSANIDYKVLKEALRETARKRNSSHIVSNYRGIIEIIRRDEIMHKRWENYQKDFAYAADILFIETCDTIVQLMDSLFAG